MRNRSPVCPPRSPVAAPFARRPAAHAQPATADKPIHIIVTFTPGGAPDILARLIGERLSAAWSQPVMIDNKPGAGGNTGADFVAKAPPDGLTIVVGTVGTHAINGALYAKMPYDMVKDFAPITLLATTPNLLVVNNDVPAKTLAEFIALGKREGKMTFASSGSGTSIHVSGELFKTMTGIDMTHVPYKGRASAIPDLLGGRVTMMFDNMPSSLPLVKEGKLRALGVTSPKRSPAAPEIPTIAEQGLPGFEAVSWFALFAPAGTPRPIVDRLQGEVKKILSSPDIAKKLAEIGLESVGSSPTSSQRISAPRSPSGPRSSRTRAPRSSDALGARSLLVEQDRGDDAGRDRGEHVVAAGRDPVVAARGRAQVMAAPVVDDILAAAVLGRQAVAAIPRVVGAGSATVPIAVVAVVVVVVAAVVVAASLPR